MSGAITGSVGTITNPDPDPNPNPNQTSLVDGSIEETPLSRLLSSFMEYPVKLNLLDPLNEPQPAERVFIRRRIEEKIRTAPKRDLLAFGEEVATKLQYQRGIRDTISGLELLSKVILALEDDDDKLNLISKIEPFFTGDPLSAIRNAAIGAMGEAICSLSAGLRYEKTKLIINFLKENTYSIEIPPVIETFGKIIPNLTKKEQMNLASEMEGIISGPRYPSFRVDVALQVLALIVPHLEATDKVVMMKKVLLNLLAPIHGETFSDNIPSLSTFFIAVFSGLHFPKGKISLATLFGALYPDSTLKNVLPPPLGDIDVVNVSRRHAEAASLAVSQNDYLVEGNILGVIVTMFEGVLLIYREPNSMANRDALLRELALSKELKSGGYQSQLIRAIGKAGDGIVFEVPQDYYLSLADVTIPWDKFETGLLKSIHDVFLLARQGYYYLSPFWPKKMQNRSWLFDHIEAGLLEKNGQPKSENLWKELTLRAERYSVTGLTDLAQLVTLNELSDRDNHGSLEPKVFYDIATLGNHLLAAALYVGNRFIKSKQSDDADDDELAPYADLLKKIFTLAYQVKQGVSDVDANNFMAGQANWTNMVREIAQYISGSSIRLTSDQDRFPVRLISLNDASSVNRVQFEADVEADESSGLDGDVNPGLYELESASLSVFIPVVPAVPGMSIH